MSTSTFSQLDAIAYGVRARYNLNESRPGASDEETVINEVVGIARKLRIPKDTIEEWVASSVAGSRAKAKIVEVLAGRPVSSLGV